MILSWPSFSWPSFLWPSFNAKKMVIVAAVLAFCVPLSETLAQEPGENIATVYGFVSSIPGTGEPSREVTFETPQAGRNYKVKIYFMKAEVSAFMIDAYFDGLDEKDKRDSGFGFWNRVREQIKDVESKAHYEVFNSSGNSVGKVRDIGLIPLFKTVTVDGDSSRYHVRIRCTEGAGLFRLVFQYE